MKSKTLQNMGNIIINWTPVKFKKLRTAYDKALNNNVKIFTFEGHEFVTAYAKYLIEHLTNKFNDKATTRTGE